MNERKFELPSEEVADQFKTAVVRKGGDAYQWWRTSTVVMRGEVPEGFNAVENHHVTGFDILMLNVAGV